ncbi:MAG: hypothetical protein ABUL43_02250, partial [Hyphomicrobium sp.]
ANRPKFVPAAQAPATTGDLKKPQPSSRSRRASGKKAGFGETELGTKSRSTDRPPASLGTFCFLFVAVPILRA